MKKAILALGLAVVALSTSACVYGPWRGHDWCYNHPYRCR